MLKEEEKELREIMTMLEDFAIKYDHKQITGGVIVDKDKKEIYSNLFECNVFTLSNNRSLFKPYLCMRGENRGIIGTETKMKDIRGEKLYVGDVVTIISDTGRNCGKNFVAQDNRGYFVMAIRNDCKVDGKIINGWKVVKEKSFKEVIHNETYTSVTVILNDNE